MPDADLHAVQEKKRGGNEPTHENIVFQQADILTKALLAPEGTGCHATQGSRGFHRARKANY